MPAIGSTFETQEPFLRELLERVHAGKVQLPDFQRGWVWDDDRIRSLIASISLSYPIGAAMFMETGGDGMNFAPRLIQGVILDGAPPAPENLILDGQQRITSLYTSIRSQRPVDTFTEKREPIRRFYYLDMELCLDPVADRLDAVRSIPEGRILKTDFDRQVVRDLSTPAAEFTAHYFPLALLFDDVKRGEWMMGYQEHHQYARERMQFLNRFQSEVLQRFLTYKVPVIELLKDTPKEAVCQVFENVNTGGVALTVFELLTATFAADNFRLRPDWEERQKRLERHDVLSTVSETDFVQAVTLLSTFRRNQRGEGAVGAKRMDMLKLTLAEYRAHAPAIEGGFSEVARLLLREKIFTAKNLPYQSQLVPLAAIFAILGPDAERDEIKRKLARWYWCGVFGELYGGATEARFALDVQQVPAWIQGGQEPRTIGDANFSPTRFLTLQTRLSAAYKGFMARLMQLGSLDLRTGDAIELTTYMDDSVDIHHLFPAAYCEERNLDRRFWNSIINKAPLTAKTNRSIGKKAPSVYLGTFEKTLGAPRVDEVLRSHGVHPTLMRGDDFSGFTRARAARLLDLIEDSTGKAIAGRSATDVVQLFQGSLGRE
jgi:hypothetical protein